MEVREEKRWRIDRERDRGKRGKEIEDREGKRWRMKEDRGGQRFVDGDGMIKIER